MGLRARGWSVAAAGREVGVSRTTGANWSRGYKTYRRGVAVGFVAALDRLEVKQVSTRYLSLDERVRIADLRQRGISIRQVASELGRSPSTVSRELRRPVTVTAGDPAGYQPFEAHRHAVRTRARPRRRRADANPLLHTLIAELLNQRWSPQQIARHLRSTFPDDPRMWLCHESIYQAVYQPGSALMRPSRLAPHRRSPLRSGRDHRRAHQHLNRRRPRFEHPMATIHDRPFPPEDRTQAGHWEGDLIVGRGQASVIGTLVERQTRMVRLLHLRSRDSDSLHAALVAQLADLPPGLLRSITWDQGSEMARHLSITASIGVKIYFCDSRSPWQRGSNENANGVLRDYFPKGADLSVYLPDHLQAVQDEINRRPRLVLENRSPAQLFAALLASQDPSVLRR
jgi:transposase, IS30 family